MTAERQVIGWREWVGLPELGVDRIRAKIDTGARSSSLHAYGMERYSVDGVEMVRFRPEPARTGPVVEMPVVAERVVRNPGGRSETRPVISTRLRWNGRLWRIELNLTRRDEMGFRMLLGRQALGRRLVIDPGRSFLGGIDPRKE
jgi:hypothetical protein